ncbi:hypothetical protein B9Z55_005371 [Caenorhabditis nigoni]|uniref:CX domain-containing protein n=1 Tax=Caenorhabditis nigoni TaxID=1611254 RepID=A0A2G5V0M3_9PELO|nr:hypothetical protein B9Z55_005371 [Caenorhabditis nigoni]
MKVITFLTLTISISSILCSKYCAQMDFDPEDIFDTDKSYMKHVARNYTKHTDETYCYVSFHANITEHQFVVNRMSDCASTFRGQIKAGNLNGNVPETLKKNKCYYQHNWIICVCSVTYCNSPQYWTLMLARFAHDKAPKTRLEPKAFEDARTVAKMANVQLQINQNVKSEYRDNLRCLVWLADTVNQAEENPPFYLYNYITTVHRSPPLADALANAPVLRRDRDWGTIDNHTLTQLHLNLKEPFEDGTHETDRDYKTYPHELAQDNENADFGLYIVAVGTVWWLIALSGTIVFLIKICRRAQDHSQFSRINDVRCHRRYERCFKSPVMPKEFEKVRRCDIKKNDMEAGASIK